MRSRDNDLLTRTGRGTLMGELMRHYWLPALKSEEVVADGPPVRLRLLGENLIAFRTTTGSVGIFDHRCPHRGASLFFGRNEEGGIRCVYHGWKYDVTGKCVDTPSELPGSNIKDKVSATAYSVRERGGVVWVYLGKAASLPELPQLDANLLPESNRWVKCGMRECNWLQALEGDIDPTHLSFLHLGFMSADDFPVGSSPHHYLLNRAPRFEVVETDYGTMYGAYRPADNGNNYWRVAQFLLPFWTMPTGGPITTNNVLARAWVPIDDEHTMFWHLSRPVPTRPPVLDGRQAKKAVGVHFEFERFVPNTTGWLGRNRYKDTAENDYGIDREIQRTGSYTGIDGAHMQDQAITESMGPIVDRTREHLGHSDEAIIHTRRRLLREATRLHEERIPPSGAAEPEIYAGVRGGEMKLAADADWLEAYKKMSAGLDTRDATTASMSGQPAAHTN